MKRLIAGIIPVCILLFLFASCKKEETVYYIKCNPETLQIGKEGGTFSVAVSSNSGWNVSIPSDWATSSLTSVNTSVTTVYLRFSFTENTGKDQRVQDISIVSKYDASVKATLRVEQAGTGEGPVDPDPDPDAITLSVAAMEIPCSGGTYSFDITSTNEWRFVSSTASWCTMLAAETSGVAGSFTIHFVADTSKQNSSRTAELFFKTITDSSAVIRVTQRPLGISVLEDLIAFRDDVNYFRELDKWMDKDSVIHLLADIDMSTVSNWTPIGFQSNVTLYTTTNSSIKGTFNGNNHTVKNLKLTSTGSKSAGLFGCVIDASIKNLILDAGCLIKIKGSSSYTLAAGGVCGTLMGGTIDNCHFNGTVEITDANNVFTGGIAGNLVKSSTESNPTTLSGCSNSGNITGNSSTGGIAGKSTGSFITSCQNTSSALIKGTTLTGGICGQVLLKCGITKSDNYGRVQGTQKVGGISGEMYDNAYITQCNNSAQISGTSSVGGLCGSSLQYSYIQNGINSGRISAKSEMGGICGKQYKSCFIGNCTNRGTVISSGTEAESSSWIGGITGYSDDSDVTDCSNSGEVSGPFSVGGICGHMGYVNGPFFVIRNCANTAPVSGVSAVGGVCGFASGTGIYIKGSTNNANVTGYTGVGGICGRLTSGALISESCVNESGWTVEATGGIAGGICGSVTASNSSISDAENGAAVKSVLYAGGIVGYSMGRISDSKNTGAVQTPMNETNGDESDVSGFEDVTIEDITVSGGIAAVSETGMTGCVNEGPVSGFSAAGVVARFASSSTERIYDCSNSATVEGTSNAAGIAGSNTGGGTVQSCTNTGNITGSTYVGGVVAANHGGAITESNNSGAIAGTASEASDSFFAIGGICAYNKKGNITNCANTGSVTRICQTGTYKFVGGVCGYTTSENTSSAGKLTGCSNAGTVIGYVTQDENDTNKYCYVGGFCGFFHSGTVDETCTHTGTVNGAVASDTNMYGGTN
ncbi:MAG TPA: BACON domain-containing protein [Bacteroidales bacterium]|nr:BACON domain-containing protein [Bacteroidales bacterium]